MGRIDGGFALHNNIGKTDEGNLRQVKGHSINQLSLGEQALRPCL